jgi:hypothetical protein
MTEVERPLVWQTSVKVPMCEAPSNGPIQELLTQHTIMRMFPFVMQLEI